MSHLVYIALGSNLGDRIANLQRAQAALPPAVRMLSASPIYETPPWGYFDQPAFLNQVVQVETDLSPLELLSYLKKLELCLGRQSEVRFGPRLIDLDIIFYDNLVMDTPDLSVPHPRLAGRAFVLVPLADLAADFHHPVENKTVRELLEETDTSGITLYKP